MIKTTPALRNLVLAGLILAFLGCAADEPPLVGVLLPLTGEAAVFGEPLQRGVLLAEEDLREARAMGLYPYDLRIEVLDTRGDPGHAARLLAALYDRGAVAVVGGVTEAESLALAEVAEEAGRVLVSPTALAVDVPESRNFFRLAPTVGREANKMANFATRELGLRKVAIVSRESGPARTAAAAFQGEVERNGGEVVARLSYAAAAELSPAELGKVADSGAQGVYLADFARGGEDVAESLHRRGYRGVILATSAFSAPDLLTAAPRASDGALVTQSMMDLDGGNPRVERFAEAYRRRWGAEPELFAAHGYDAVEVVAQAVMTQEARPRELWKGLRFLEGYRGVTGYLQFDERGDVGKFPRVYVVDGGRLSPVEGMPEWRKQRLARR